VSGLPADADEGRAAFKAVGFTPLLVTGDLADENSAAISWRRRSRGMVGWICW